MSSAVVAIPDDMTVKSTKLLEAIEKRCSAACSAEPTCKEGNEIFRQYYLANLKTHIKSSDAWPTVLEALTTSHLNAEGTQERYPIDAFIPLATQIGLARAEDARAGFAAKGTWDSGGKNCVFSSQPFTTPENANQPIVYVFQGVGKKKVHFRCYSDRAFQSLPKRDDPHLGLLVTAEGFYDTKTQENLRISIQSTDLGNPQTLGDRKYADGVITVPDSGRTNAKAMVYKVALKTEFIDRYVPKIENGVRKNIPDYIMEQLAYSRFAWLR